MLTVKCPKCATALKLRQAPAGGKVKCPKCSSVIPVAAAASAGAVAASAALSPDDEGFDFGNINAPAAGSSAVSHFPVQKEQLSVYQGPIPGDPNELDPIEQDTGPKESVPAPVRAPHVQLAGEDPENMAEKKKSPVMLILAIIGVLAVVGGGGAAAFMFIGGGSGQSSPEDDLPQVIIAE